MRKMTALALCLVLAVCAVSFAAAESTGAEDELYNQWAAEYGDNRLWDWQVNAEFARQNPQLWTEPSAMPVLPPDDGETCSAEKAKKLAFRLIPQFGAEITSDMLFDLTCIVSSYRKPEFPGSFYSINGAWDVEFWDTRGEEPRFVCAIYIDAVTEDPDVLLLAGQVRYECQYESPQEAVRVDPDGENSDAGRARMTARNIVSERFTADYGINEYYADLVNEFGPFRFWTPAQKYEYCAVLTDLLFWERDRLTLYHSGEERQYGLLDEPVLQWRYAAPETAAIPEEGAVQNALDFLKAEYGTDCSACRVSAALYTGNANHIEPFADPFWVIAFYNETADREAEVWVNANTGATPKHRAEDVEDVVREQFAEAMAEGYEIGGRPVTEDMIDDVAVMYLETEEQWYGVVTVWDTYWEIEIDADTLEPLDTSRSNG